MAGGFLIWQVWLEDWSSPLTLGKKFMKGKLVYQKGEEAAYFARPFRFQDGLLIVPPGAALEEALAAVLATDKLKLGCNV